MPAFFLNHISCKQRVIHLDDVPSVDSDDSLPRTDIRVWYFLFSIIDPIDFLSDSIIHLDDAPSVDYDYIFIVYCLSPRSREPNNNPRTK